MKVLKNIRYEEKNELGISLFAIDLIIYEEYYYWNEESSSFVKKYKIDPSCPKDNQHRFLSVIVKPQFPFDLRVDNLPIQNKIAKIEKMSLRSNIKDELLIKELKELSKLILEIPNISKIYLPNFALDKEGNFDESFVLEQIKLEQYTVNNPKHYHLGEYAIRLFTKINDEKSYVFYNENKWLCDLQAFYMSYYSNYIINIKLSKEEALDIVDPSLKNLILDVYHIPGHFFYVNSIDDDDDDTCLGYMNENNEIMFFTCL
jgi:hypothetical protein